MTMDDIADAAAMPKKDVVKGIAALSGLMLIDTDPNIGSLFIVKWNERQFESDDTSLRTAKHRSKERSNDNDVTPQRQKTDTESSPPTPPEGGRRANGTNPRSVAKKRELDSLRSLIAECSECGDNPNVLCSRCTGLNRKISELVNA